MATKNAARPTRIKELAEMGIPARNMRERRAWLAEQAGVDTATLKAWESGTELPPDEIVEWLADECHVSVRYMMGWDDAPRSVIPERWRRRLAEDAAERAARALPRECEHLLHWIEWRLDVERDLPGDSPDVPRLQRLRATLIEFLTEPMEAI